MSDEARVEHVLEMGRTFMRFSAELLSSIGAYLDPVLGLTPPTFMRTKAMKVKKMVDQCQVW